MTSYTLILIINESKTNVLMCQRTKDPYEGLYNLVGGKIEPGETPLNSAYREMEEETGFKPTDVFLQPLMDYTWHPAKMKMYVFAGHLRKNIPFVNEIHPLEWIDLKENFFDMTRFAGEGNIGHMIEILKQYPSVLEEKI